MTSTAGVVGEVGRAYDARAAEYVELLGDLAQLAAPDRELVARWRDETPGLLLDAGCGPGAWTQLLQDGGPTRRRVLGLNLSGRLLESARARHPGVGFVQGTMTALPLRSGTVGGVLAWYSLIHTVPMALPATLAELRRVLAPGAGVLLGFVDGPAGEAFPHKVVTAYHWSVDALADLLAAVGLEVVEHHHRRDEGHRAHGALVARLP